MAEYISFQPNDYFKTLLYSGDASVRSLTYPDTTAMQPDLVWIKDRTGTGGQAFTDSVRGATKEIWCNTSTVQTTVADSLTAFDSDGFSLGADAASWGTNMSGRTYGSWSWKAGTTSGIAGSPSITPTGYSFNQTSGFSIIAYTGTTTGGETIPHGLGVAPNMVIVKKLDGANHWGMYHSGVDATAPEDYSLTLSSTNVRDNSVGAWHDTAPTSTLLSLGVDFNTGSASFIAYCFAEKKGFSKFGSYVGNGNADGTFVYTGFRPGWILMKRTNGTPNWMSYDSKRLGYNEENAYLEPNTNQEEYLTVDIDILSNGFKIRDTATSVNGTPDPYIFSAFAEFPIVSSNDIPGVAR